MLSSMLISFFLLYFITEINGKASITSVEKCQLHKCEKNGTINSLDTCDEFGQCLCRESVSGTDCAECQPGTFDLLADNYFGCQDCGCDVGGSYDPAKCTLYGTCFCKQRIHGSRCDQVGQAHYVPSLYQHKFELEDGFTTSNSSIEFGHDEDIFPGYSWRGYADFSEYQQVLINISIHPIPHQLRSSFFKVVLAYHNPGPKAVAAVLNFNQQSKNDTQEILFEFPPTSAPKKYIIHQDRNPLFLTLMEEPWIVSLRVFGHLLVDYMVLIPQTFYEATILKETVRSPCTMKSKPHELCKHYGFPKLPATAISLNLKRVGEIGSMGLNIDDFSQIEWHPVTTSPQQKYFTMRKGEYVLMIHYIYQPADQPLRTMKRAELAELNFNVISSTASVSVSVDLPKCSYTFKCRHVLIDAKSAPIEFDLDDGRAVVVYKLSRTMENATIEITDFIFIPISEWNIDYVKPSLICIMRNFTCRNSSYSQANNLNLNQPEELLLQDRAGEFIEECTGDAFYIDRNSSEFCRKSAFSISAHHNNGAIYCKCNSSGSIDFKCDADGGQCPCKRNVIGRDCSQCKTGYRGFPNCKKCNCPEKAAYCNKTTGECICPPNVVGLNCDRCALNAYGYHQIVGCEECRCNAAGVRNGNFQCDLYTGQCDCASLYGGLRCDRCVAKHSSFPSCHKCTSGYYRSPSVIVGERTRLTSLGGPSLGLCIPCECNGHSRECDPNTGKCLNCMHNTLGDHCEKCESGYFGNATQGAPEDCVICPCPVPSVSNNFAEACEERRVDTPAGPIIEFHCFCKPGYTGSHCEFCGAGFHGNPRAQGDYCKPRQSNSNINPKGPTSWINGGIFIFVTAFCIALLISIVLLYMYFHQN